MAAGRIRGAGNVQRIVFSENDGAILKAEPVR
jgi:hypothetical protein